MIGSITEILQITTEKEFIEAQGQFDLELNRELSTLERLLAQNILSTDVTDTEQHASLVESWGGRLVKFLSLATAFVEHAKSTTFMLPKQKGVTTDTDREAHRRHMAASSVAQVVRLEGFLDRVDSRVNLCKKFLEAGVAGAARERRV